MSFDMDDVRRLSQKAQEQIAAKLAVTMVEARKMQEARSKYCNKKTVVETNGTRMSFDSRKEARRYKELLILLRAGEIRDLHLQEHFTLTRPYKLPNGEKVKREEYVADFVYRRRMTDSYGETYWQIVVEDVKGVRTTEYLHKRNRMQEVYGITIEET